jgi:hypothetical protein
MTAREASPGPIASTDDDRNRRLEKLRFWRRACADSSQTVTPKGM